MRVNPGFPRAKEVDAGVVRRAPDARVCHGVSRRSPIWAGVISLGLYALTACDSEGPLPQGPPTYVSSGSASESSGGEIGIEAGPCAPVLASAYDQSCTQDSDCVAVGEVPSCPASACAFCNAQGINQNALTAYSAAFARAVATVDGGGTCGCPCESGAICRSGKCQSAGCAPAQVDTLPACVDAGGACAYSANTTCGTAGPPDACAYSDEICCAGASADGGETGDVADVIEAP
jgi:hypothetical protein